MAAFCKVTDILTGNIPLPRGMGNENVIKQRYIDRAAEDIEARLGVLFTLPLSPAPGSFEEKVLSRINKYLATGQLIIDAAAGGEDNSLHAYGFHHLREANQAIADILAGKIKLNLDKDEPDTEDLPGGPLVLNKEPSSYVDAFYNNSWHSSTEPSKPVYPNIDRIF